METKLFEDVWTTDGESLDILFTVLFTLHDWGYNRGNFMFDQKLRQWSDTLFGNTYLDLACCAARVLTTFQGANIRSRTWEWSSLCCTERTPAARRNSAIHFPFSGLLAKIQMLPDVCQLVHVKTAQRLVNACRRSFNYRHLQTIFVESCVYVLFPVPLIHGASQWRKL